jgi:hypothetical protein
MILGPDGKQLRAPDPDDNSDVAVFRREMEREIDAMYEAVDRAIFSVPFKLYGPSGEVLVQETNGLQGLDAWIPSTPPEPNPPPQGPQSGEGSGWQG